jgi:hypothetical protein
VAALFKLRPLHSDACRWLPRGFLVCMALFNTFKNKMRLMIADRDTYSVDHHTHDDGAHVLLSHSSEFSPPLVAPQMRDNEIHRNHLPSTRRLNCLSCVLEFLDLTSHSLTTWDAAGLSSGVFLNFDKSNTDRPSPCLSMPTIFSRQHFCSVTALSRMDLLL